MREIALEEAEDLTERGLSGHPRIWESELAQILIDLDRMLLDDDQLARRAGCRGAGQ